MRQQFGGGLGRDDPRAEVGLELVEKVLGQNQHIPCSVAQSRQPQLETGQAMEEIETKRAALGVPSQIAQGGGHHAHLHGDLAAATHPPDAPGFQCAQQLGLQVHGQLANLVENQGAPGRLLEPARAARSRARESPAFVSEELTLGQLARQGATVDRDKGPLGPETQFVQDTRKQLLASSALARHQHGDAAGCHPRGTRQQQAQCWIVADDGLQGGTGRDLAHANACRRGWAKVA